MSNSVYCTKHNKSKPCITCVLDANKQKQKESYPRCGICGSRRKQSNDYCGRCQGILDRK